MELKSLYKCTYLQNRNRLTALESKLMATKGEGGWGDNSGVWDWHIHTIIFKIGNQQGALLNIL